MASRVWALYESTPQPLVGLCHSVPLTALSLANYTDIPFDALTYRTAARGERPLPVHYRSLEYAAPIIRAMETGGPVRIYGNVRNEGLISNLPHGCCVELPCLVDGNGVQPIHAGGLPAAGRA